MEEKKERPTVSKEELNQILLDSERLGYKYKSSNLNNLRVLHHIERYRFLSEIINMENKKVSIIDVGAGNGLCLEVLHNTCHKLIKDIAVVEIETEILKSAKEKISGCTAYSKIEEVDRAFDVVICHEVIGHQSIPCDAEFVKKLKSICNKILSLSIPNYGSTHHGYFRRTYDISLFNKLLKECFPNERILKCSQIHPFERNSKSDVGVWKNFEFKKPCDFMMGVVYV